MSQQRQLETLKERARAGERPAVTVDGETYEFSSVVWGGASPLVGLIDPHGATTWKTAAEWTRNGAKFAARSRSLAKVTRPTRPRPSHAGTRVAVREVMVPVPTSPVARVAEPTHKTRSQLDLEIEELLESDEGSP